MHPFVGFRRGAALLAAFFLASASSARAQDAAWDAFVGEFIEAYFEAHPDFAVYQGRREFDGRLPDWSEAGLTREADRLRAARARAEAFDPAALDPRRRFERDYLIAKIDGDLFWLVTADQPRTNPAYYQWAIDPDPYLTRNYAPLADRMRAYIGYLRSIARVAGEIRANLKTPMARTLIAIGRATFGGMASFYENDVAAVFASVDDAALQAEFREANGAAARAMRELDAWLGEQEAQATEDFALGEARFLEMIWATERVRMTIDELQAMAERDLNRNLAALEEVCGRFAPGQSVEACMAKMAANKPEGGPVAAARGQLGGLKQFILDRKIVAIPSDDEARIAESPAYARANSAYISIPGPYERNAPATYYISPPDPTWSIEDQQAYIPGTASLLSTTIHEVWPGHFLQFLHSNRSPSMFGRVFVGYAFAEGWAHYTEEMMWEACYRADDPEFRVGQLSDALLRNVRFISAIGLHARGMTVAESERLFREKGFQDPGNARQQAARGTYDPAYLNYTLGKLIIRDLRAEWTAPRGGREAWGAFHDRLLSFGGPPVGLLRGAMMDQSPAPPR